MDTQVIIVVADIIMKVRGVDHHVLVAAWQMKRHTPIACGTGCPRIALYHTGFPICNPREQFSDNRAVFLPHIDHFSIVKYSFRCCKACRALKKIS